MKPLLPSRVLALQRNYVAVGSPLVSARRRCSTSASSACKRSLTAPFWVEGAVRLTVSLNCLIDQLAQVHPMLIGRLEVAPEAP